MIINKYQVIDLLPPYCSGFVWEVTPQPTLKALLSGEPKSKWWDKRKEEGKKAINQLPDIY